MAIKKYRLTIITKNQNTPKKANKLAELVKFKLGIKTDLKLSKYDKFIESYKIEFSGDFISDSNAVFEAIELTDRIASPWVVQFDRLTEDIELIFNASANSSYRRQEFNVIHWANFQVE